MLEIDEDALFCDIAETYHVFDWSTLPLSTIARLASGLRDNARIMMRISGQAVPTDRLLLATIADNTGYVAWSKTEDARRHPESPPERISASLLGIDVKKRNEIQAFSTAEDFEKKLAELRKA